MIDKYFKLSLMAAFLLIGASVFYYFVIFLPQVTNQRLALTRQKQESEEKRLQAQQDELKAEKTQRKTTLDNCLQNSDDAYSSEWARVCKDWARKQIDGYNSCIVASTDDDKSSAAKTCRALWGIPDDSPNCSLPGKWAENVENHLKVAKADCYRQYNLK